MTTRGKLAAAGILFGAILALAAIVLAGRRPMKPNAELLVAPILPEADRPIEQVLMHYVPSQDALIDETYTDFLRALPNEAAVVFMVAQGLSADETGILNRRLATIDPSGQLARRTRVVQTPGPITTWSKDRALVTERPKGQAAWIVAPSEPSRQWQQRYNDWGTVRSFAEASEGEFRAKVAPFDFDAGDFIIDGDTMIVDTNLLEKNRHRGIANSVELRRRLSAWFRTKVLVLGEEPGDTPRHHIAMYMTPLQRGTVLVGDPRLAREIVSDTYRPGEISSDSNDDLQPDFSPEMQARFDQAADALKAAGYQVERIPNLPFDHKTYYSYTNGVFEVRGGERIAYMPIYGHEALDQAARRTYEKLGWTVKPIRVRKVYKYHGTIGCLVNITKRGT
jgi:hypothetical protein